MNRREHRRLIYPEALRLFLAVLSFALVSLVMMNLQIFSDRAFHASILEENQLLLKKIRSATSTNSTKIMEERWQSVFRQFYHEAPLFDRGFYCFPDWSDSFPMLVDVALQTFIWSTFIIHFVFPLPRCIFPWKTGESGSGSKTARLKRALAQLPCFFTGSSNSDHPPETCTEPPLSTTPPSPNHLSRPKYKCSWLFVKNRNRFRLARLYRLVVIRRIFWIISIIFLFRSFCFTSTAVPNPRPWCEYQYPKPNPSSMIMNATTNHHHLDYLGKVQKDEKENMSASGKEGFDGENLNDKWKKETMDWLRILGHMMTGEASACTDNIFSGHAAITMTCLWTWLWYQRGPAIFQIPCRRKKPLPASKNKPDTEQSMETGLPPTEAIAPSSPSSRKTPHSSTAPSIRTQRHKLDYGPREPVRVWSLYALLHALLIMFLIIATHLHYTVDVILSVIISSAIYYIYHFAVSYAELKARKEMRNEKKHIQDGSGNDSDDSHRPSFLEHERLTFPWPYYLCAVIGWMDGVDLRVKREAEANVDEEGGNIQQAEIESHDDCEGFCDSSDSSAPPPSQSAATRTEPRNTSGQASVV